MSSGATARQGYGVTPAIPVELNWSRCVLPPFNHQKAGVRELVKMSNPGTGRIVPGVFALFDEPGAGKTKQIIDSACFLADAKDIDTVLVISPANVRAVWAGEFGEIDKHAWFPSTISEYHAKTPNLAHGGGVLNWHVTNFDFIRSEERLRVLMGQLFGRKLWIVIDESIRIKGHRTASTKAVLKLASFARRRTILNGTPISNNPLDLWAQFEFLDPRIIGCQNFYHFRSRYAILKQMDGFKKVVGWQNLEELQAKIAPYVLRRLKKDCLDLPDKTFTVREAVMKPDRWKQYKQMRDECVAFLDPRTASVAPQAIVRLLRLSQMTAGFLGGINPEIDLATVAGMSPIDAAQALANHSNAPREIGREKLDAFLETVEDLLEEDPDLRLLVWCRFRAELDRVAKAVAERWPGVRVGRIEGGQSEKDRRTNVDDFQQGHAGPFIMFGNPQAGGLGITLTAAHRVIYLSNDYNLINRLQSEDRVHRPGQRHPVLYTDFVATGPEGQRTIDHVILNALRKKQNLADWTTDVWRRELSA